MLEHGFGIMPKELLYDNQISSSAKLLFVELSSLCAQQGHCWATNSYLAAKFEVSERTISAWIQELLGYIQVDGSSNQHRKIRMQHDMVFPQPAAWKKTSRGVEENFQAIYKKNNIKVINKGVPPVVEGLDPVVYEAFHEFQAFRKQIRKPLTPQAIKLTVKKLNDLAPNQPQIQIAIINQSIERGWSGVFDISDGTRKQRTILVNGKSMESPF